MKRFHLIFLILALLALAAPTSASDFVQSPHPTAFRGMAFGASLEELQGLSPVPESGYEGTYFRQNEDLVFGKAKIKSIAYYFRKGKLYRVGIAYNGRVNQFYLKDMLMQQFGPGRGIGTRYGWMWPDFSIDISYDDEHDTGGLFYTYEGSLD